MVTNQLRIIGGQWRGRKLRFADGEGLRPTTDRIRETLFNWLQGIIEGARCLDLYAGSGALGLEALSRGAGEVVFWEKNPKAVHALRENLALLKAGQAELVQTNSLQALQGPARPFDLVFVDPPFGRERLQPSLDLLASGGWLAPGARIYIEHASKGEGFELPPGWELLRSKQAGQVAYHLAKNTAGT
ncbi:MAG: 16S rRNA (guanine(966)-N(2))-methyltransferase RsmD [Chromatiales bacterium]|nr:16S rRNA (guanine(966)-N(2))-methyltransferase RsmD [Gammaproteobacteria bacterium]MBW6475860.1 16S rRNA (guanine(966)-N(2))-methyltransferase RsmD [Chromatiales bacterium]